MLGPILCIHMHIWILLQIRVRFEVFTAATTKNAVFWDIKSEFLPHRKHFTSPLEPN
jgi:hypothetical protein